jgi:copper homeostasis protein
MAVLVEACVDSVASAVAAERGGAGRLELCDNLFDGGTTPSAGMISAVKAAVHIPVFVIIRPRGGGFFYSDAELGVMRLDIEAARMLGADGIVLGALTADSQVATESMRALLDSAGSLPSTFHRAFDLTPDLGKSLETIMALGVKRVLTSGGAAKALDGVPAIASLVKRAAGSVTIMAGGGLREENVQEIVHRTGVSEVHVRGTRLLTRGTTGNAALRLRKDLPSDEAAWEETDERRIKEFVRLANG